MVEALPLMRPLYRNALILVWMVAGSVPQRVAGFDELLTDQGLYKISAKTSGQTGAIAVKTNAVVKPGD